MRQRADVRIECVSKKYARGIGTTALADIDLTIRPGEFVALIGPSGCGKSTLLRLIASLERPTAGQVLIDGKSPRVLAKAHGIGIAFQDHGLLPWLTAAENIALPFKLAGRPTDAARVETLIDLVGLEGFEAARPAHLSGGMRQRVAIARSIALEPELLLLDEPFGALDAVTRRYMNIELQRIWAEMGPTTVLVTHAVDEALFLADRVIVLGRRPGRIVHTLDVPFERPRGPSLQRTPLFHELADSLVMTLECGVDA